MAVVSKAKLHDFIDRAGAGAVIMASPDARDYLREFTDPHDWHLEGKRSFYRGALVELHDEWSWGWMVRKSDGTYVKAASGTEARRAETATEIGGSVHDGPTGVAGDAQTPSSEQPQ